MAGLFNELLVLAFFWVVMHIPAAMIAALVSGCGPTDGWAPGYNKRLAVAAFGLALFASYFVSAMDSARDAAERCL